jgi:hypothetical protein
MKKIFLIAPILLIANISLSFSSAQEVREDGFSRLTVGYSTPDINFVSSPLNGEKTMRFDIAGFQQGGEVGSPSLPVRNDIIEVPFCDDIVVTVTNAVYDTFQMPMDANRQLAVLPLQPSRSKSDTAVHQPVINTERYQISELWGLPLAEVEYMGIARDRRLATLRFSPLQVNPVTGEVVVCKSADVTVTFVGADADSTLRYYQRYHTPAFSVGTTLNNLFADAKSAGTPVRMVIAVPNVLRCQSLQRFADWKRRQGLLVDLFYYEDNNIYSNTDLATYFTSLYTNSSADAPAPTYIILVGDNGQLPAFNSRLSTSYYGPDNDHITDLYFATWTSGDKLPDCYQGRFSATDTATLLSIVNKTLLYEQYAFPDDGYLSKAALVAGEDNGYHDDNYDYAWRYADPTMDYLAYYYVNAGNGFSEVKYYKNDVNYAPSGVTVTGYCSSSSSASALRTYYSQGVGWINYSAHGDWDCWHKPSFTVNHVSSMNNSNRPSIMIGNCCLSSKFDKPTCFAEALLRRGNNAGAVAYIGGTNSTYWEQDFDWSVGVRSNITHTLSPSYNASKLGVYDRLFHTHNESFTKHAVTTGAMLYYGNLAVNSSSSSNTFKQYYWEIYELMGDPSLLPWLGQASDISLSAVRSDDVVTVTTEPNAYVALVDNNTLELYAAAHASDNGVISLELPHTVDKSTVLLSVTAQNRKPFSQILANIPNVGVDTPNSLASLSLYPNPATDRVSIEGLPQDSRVDLFDASGRQVASFDARQSTFSFQLPSGVYLLRIQTASDVAVRKLVVNK